MKILAVDPGYEKIGIAILEKNSGKEELVFSECFKTSRKISPQERLLSLGQEVMRVIEEYHPSALSIEKLFFEVNQKTAMLVSEARGVIIYEAVKAGLKIEEFTPLQVKVAVTSYGKSSKNQVKYMVDRLIKIKKSIKEDDEYDAIALGLTYFACVGKN
jgi:crossover junction endodeoxyribonuclease RuvC